jgi:deoxyribonuclease-4
MGRDALSVGATYFQFFTRNPRGSKAKDIDPEDISKLRILMKENGIAGALAHAPYTLNPSSAEDRVRNFAEEVMKDDLKRLEMLPGSLYNLHPGSHVGQGIEKGIELTIEILDKVMWEDQTTTVLLETMSGKGSELGKSFEELAMIIEGSKYKDKLGICLDTCHIFDAGMDVVDGLDEVLGEFDRIIGLEKLMAIHINDSKNPLGSRKDRHAKIGEGMIGVDAFGRIINHPLLRNLPFLLETPNELEGYKEEIALLKSLYK